ncbi:MAG: ABC transporter transmembrane domain-containing protein [Halioglobus sp.]
MRSTLFRWRQLLEVLNRFSVKHRRWLVQGMIAAVGVTLLRLALPWPLQALFLPLLDGGHTVSPAWIPSELNVTLVAGALFALCVAALGYADARLRLCFASFSIRTVGGLRKEAMRGLTRSSKPGIPVRSGDIVARLIGDTARVKAGVKGFLVHVAVNGLLLIGITLVMLYIDIWIGTLFGLCLVVVFAVTLFGAKNIYETAAKYRDKEGRLADAIVRVSKVSRREASDNVMLPKVSRKARANYKKVNRSSGRSEARITKLTGYATWAAHALLGLFVFVAVIYGTNAMESGTLSSAKLLLFALYILTARTPVVQLARQGVRTGKILACLGRLDELIEAPPPASKASVTTLSRNTNR